MHTNDISCDYCGRNRSSVKRRNDPYALQVNDVEVKVDICASCNVRREGEALAELNGLTEY